MPRPRKTPTNDPHAAVREQFQSIAKRAQDAIAHPRVHPALKQVLQSDVKRIEATIARYDTDSALYAGVVATLEAAERRQAMEEAGRPGPGRNAAPPAAAKPDLDDPLR